MKFDSQFNWVTTSCHSLTFLKQKQVKHLDEHLLKTNRFKTLFLTF